MSIKVEALEQAIKEAKRFIQSAETVKRMAATHDYGIKYYDGGQYCAAAKRASMDLTRALVAVRRGS